MGLVELILLAIGLAMDAFAVSVCKGLAMKKITIKNMLICGLWFGGFQGLMPLIGYFAGIHFAAYIANIDHWVACILLLYIGIKMVKGAFSNDEDRIDDSLNVRIMFIMAVMTSIDALAAGVTLICLPARVFPDIPEYANTLVGAGIIGIITFIISCGGVKIGSIFGTRYKKKAEISGGVILILLGCKVLLEHLIKGI